MNYWDEKPQVCAAMLKDGYVVGYFADKMHRKSTQDWLNSLPIVTRTWFEPVDVFRNRKKIGLPERL